MGLNPIKTMTVLNGASTSEKLNIRDLFIGVLFTPATMDATTVVAFQASLDGATFANVYDEFGALVYITAALNAAGCYNIPDVVMKNNYIKIFTCTTGAVAVNQTGNKVFTLVAKG